MHEHNPRCRPPPVPKHEHIGTGTVPHLIIVLEALTIVNPRLRPVKVLSGEGIADLAGKVFTRSMRNPAELLNTNILLAPIPPTAKDLKDLSISDRTSLRNNQNFCYLCSADRLQKPGRGQRGGSVERVDALMERFLSIYTLRKSVYQRILLTN